MKHLPPTLREDQRYLAVKIDTSENIEFETAVELINDSVKQFAGEKGLAEAAPWLIKRKFDQKNKEVVVRINREFEDTFRAAITLSEQKMFTLKASGTLKSL